MVKVEELNRIPSNNKMYYIFYLKDNPFTGVAEDFRKIIYHFKDGIICGHVVIIDQDRILFQYWKLGNISYTHKGNILIKKYKKFIF